MGETGSSPAHGTTIVVGVKLTSECRELLTWIVAKLSQPGDHIVAVHVVPESEAVLDFATKKRLDNTFEAVLGVYQSICNLKQVRLDIKVVSGSSLRKAILESVKVENAAALVLGCNKHRCSEPVEKYCVKRLPASCFVIIVQDGKIISEKQGTCHGNFFAKNQAVNNACDKGDRPIKGNNQLAKCHIQPAQHAGWPLMHRSISLEKASAARSVSVVKWAMQLPDRLKEALDKQGGHVTRKLASDQQDSVPRLLSPPKSGPKNSVDRLEEVVKAQAVNFPRKIDLLCKDGVCVRFSYEELQNATINFSTKNLVGKGGCSKVYKGILDGRDVAVKCLSQGATEADDELLTELETLTTLNHPYIVRLLGYCIEGNIHILVYNFAPNGNLEENLQNKDLLNWQTRHKIAVGAADALKYLHDACPRPVIHRDVKSSNILLSSSFEPQISDFGLAKWAPTSSTYITCSDVVGTLGYLAPEYFMFGRVNDKTDVYSFGVVLLEIISGRPSIDNQKPKGQENLVAWAKPFLDSGHIEQLVDPRLCGKYDENQLRNMVAAASSCVRQSPKFRPRMSRVLKMISGEEISSVDFKAEEYFSEDLTEKSGDVRKHLALAMMGVDDDVASQSSVDIAQLDSKNLNDYLGGRYSRSSSFD